MKKKLTINDIANAAGVSKTTVSRYLNGRYDLMSAETKKRIESIVEMTGYRPNAAAQNLKSRRTKMIGVTIADMFSPFSSALVLGISNVLENEGYQPLFVNCSDSLDKEKELISSLLARGVDGLLVNTVSYQNSNLVNLATSGIPIVLCDRYIEDFNFDIVTNTLHELFPQVLSHLKYQGFLPPYLFSQPYTNNSSRFMRVNSFCNSIKKIYDIKDPEKHVIQIDISNSEAVKDKILNIIKESNSLGTPCILGVNAVTTLNLLTQITSINLQVPNDIGICGPDDWSWKKYIDIYEIINTGISSMVFDSLELGRQAAKLLLKRINNPDMPKQTITVPSEFIIRNSTLLK